MKISVVHSIDSWSQFHRLLGWFFIFFSIKREDNFQEPILITFGRNVISVSFGKSSEKEYGEKVNVVMRWITMTCNVLKSEINIPEFPPFDLVLLSIQFVIPLCSSQSTSFPTHSTKHTQHQHNTWCGWWRDVRRWRTERHHRRTACAEPERCTEEHHVSKSVAQRRWAPSEH